MSTPEGKTTVAKLRAYLARWGSAWVMLTLAASSLLSLGWASAYRRHFADQDVRVALSGTDENRFVDHEELRNALRSAVEEIDLPPVQASAEVLRDNTYLTDIEIDEDANFGIRVRAKVRKPVARVIGMGPSFYVEDSGRYFPWSPTFSARVLLIRWPKALADTAVAEHRAQLRDWTDFGLHLAQDSLLSHLVAELEVNSLGEGTLHTQIGNLQIQVGAPERAVEKLAALKVFVQSVLTRTGWGIYRSVDLRYTGQVIARKR